MRKDYYDYLPRNYFNNLYERVVVKLIRGQNVLVSALQGGGGKTFLNLFLRLNEKEKVFPKIYYYDPYIEKENLVEYVRNIKDKKIKKLVIVRLFEKIEQKRETLETLNSFRYPNPELLVFLIITNHTGITDQEQYFATTTTFFSERFYIEAFNFEETKIMLRINNKFFAWNNIRCSPKRVYELSGGIPRLIKYIPKNIVEKHAVITNLSKFKEDPAVFFQLEYLTKLLISLPKDKLVTLGLIDSKGKIKGELLEAFFKSYSATLVLELYPGLSSLEKTILTYLYENEERVVSMEKLGDLFEMKGHEFSLWAIYKLISRLKQKVKNNFELNNVKGSGYILTKLTKKESPHL